MDLISEIEEQLRSAQRAVDELIRNKENNENLRKEGEQLNGDFKKLHKKINTAVGELEHNLNTRTEQIPGNFGAFYRDKVNGAVTKGEVKNLDGQGREVLSSFVNKLLDLDDIIADLAGKITDKNGLIQQLRDKLNEILSAIT